jgi:hypothetical protein
MCLAVSARYDRQVETWAAACILRRGRAEGRGVGGMYQQWDRGGYLYGWKKPTLTQVCHSTAGKHK